MPADNEAAIEAAAKAMAENSGFTWECSESPGECFNDDCLAHSDVTEARHEDYRELARAAIAAYEAELDKTSVRVPREPTREQLDAIDAAIGAGARAEAEFDGREWLGMGRLDRERYHRRFLVARAAYEKALSAAPPAREG